MPLQLKRVVCRTQVTRLATSAEALFHRPRNQRALLRFGPDELHTIAVEDKAAGEKLRKSLSGGSKLFAKPIQGFLLGGVSRKGFIYSGSLKTSCSHSWARGTAADVMCIVFFDPSALILSTAPIPLSGP